MLIQFQMILGIGRELKLPPAGDWRTGGYGFSERLADCGEVERKSGGCSYCRRRSLHHRVRQLKVVRRHYHLPCSRANRGLTGQRRRCPQGYDKSWRSTSTHRLDTDRRLESNLVAKAFHGSVAPKHDRRNCARGLRYGHFSVVTCYVWSESVSVAELLVRGHSRFPRPMLARTQPGSGQDYKTASQTSRV